MADVFDELDTAPKTDVFDEIEAPAPVSAPISGGVLGSETTRSLEPEVLSEKDPRFPEVAANMAASRIVLDQFLLPARVDAFDLLSQAQRSERVATAEVAARRAEERLKPLRENPVLLMEPAAQAMVTEARQLRERAVALNERYQADTPLGRINAEEAATAQRDAQRRKDFEASGEGPGVVGTFLEQVAGMATNTLGGIARTFAPSIGGAPGDALIRQGAEMTELANVNQSLGGKVARGAGTVAGLLAGNPAGAIPATAAVGLKGAMDAYAQTLSATGSTSEADRAAASTFPALALYMATGIAGARGAAAMVPKDASAAQKALAGFGGAAISNIGTTAAMGALNGEGYGVEQLTADTLLAIFHAKGEYSRAKAEARDAAKSELENRGFTEEQLQQEPTFAETPAKVVELPAERAPIPELAEPVRPVPEEVAKVPSAPEPVKAEEMSDEALAAESTEDLIARTKNLEERATAFTARKEAIGRLVRTLKKGDVVVEPDGSRHVVDYVSKDGTIWTLGGEDGQSGQYVFVAGDKVERVESTEADAARRKLGPGAANIEEFAPQKQIAAYNEAVDQQRAQRGLPPLMSEARKPIAEIWDKAEQRMEADPTLTDRLVNEANAGERKAFTDEEQAAVLWKMTDLTGKLETEYTRIGDENLNATERAEAESRARLFEEQLGQIEEANRKAGTEWGRSGRTRQIIANADFTLASMVGKARKAKGAPLTPEERTKVQQQAEAIQRTEEAFQERVEEVEAGAPVDAAIKAIETSGEPDFAPEVRSLSQRIIDRLDVAASAALRRLKAKGMAQLGSAPDPTIIADAVIYGAAKIGKGLVKSGQWAASMVRDLGEWVRPHLDEIWAKANADIDENIQRGVAPKNRAKVKQAVTKANAVATADQIGEQMKARVNGGEKLTEMRGSIQKLVETLVRGGIKERNALVDTVHEVLKGIDPAITRRQTMDAISGYGDFKPLNPDTVKAEVRDLKGQLQQVAKLEDIAAGQPMKKTGVERRAPSDEERALIKQVNELAKEKGVKVTDPAVQLRAVVGAIETRLTNRIKDLKAEIAKGERLIKERKAPPTSPKIEALRAELSKVEAEHEAVFGKEGISDATRLKAYKTRTQKRMAELEGKIAAGDFQKPAKRPPLDISKDPEAVRLKAEAERVKGEFQKGLRAAERSTWSRARRLWEGTKSIADASANLATSLDVSALRQGVKAFTMRPIQGVKNLGAMLRAFASETKAREIEQEILLRPNAKKGLYKDAGLALTPLDESSFTKAEENMGSWLAEKLPGVRPSNRAFKTFLNRMRADSFDAIVGMKDGTPPTKAELEAIGNFVNIATGRGNFGKFNAALPLLGRVYWSPRLLLSQIQFLAGQPLWKGSAWTRKVIAGQYGRYLAGTAALYTLASMMGARVGEDPRSADFGKVIIGDTRIDPLGGLSQVMTLIGRLAKGQTKDAAGKVKKARPGDVLGAFNRSKLAPLTGTAWDIISRKQYGGKPTTIGSVVRNIFVPLSLRELPEDIKQEGLAKAITLWALNLFGISARSY